jgi:E3 ubiquitin-protein ligase RNF25
VIQIDTCLLIVFSGDPVLYSLIDDCREFLTAHNYPSCPCSICLFHIVQADSFVKTSCYHYFHAACFGRYLQAYEPDLLDDDLSGIGPKQPPKPDNLVPCPVCRSDLPKDQFNPVVLIKERESVLQPQDVEVFVRSDSMEALQKQMQSLFECQKKRGAIVNSSTSLR